MAIQGSHQETVERVLPKDRGFGYEREIGIWRQFPEDFGIVGYVVRNLGKMGTCQRLW
jgi:hypothetical protein